MSNIISTIYIIQRGEDKKNVQRGNKLNLPDYKSTTLPIIYKPISSTSVGTRNPRTGNWKGTVRSYEVYPTRYEKTFP